MYEKVTSSDINAAAEELRTTRAAKMKRSVTQQQTSRMDGLFNVSQLLWQSSKTSDRFNKKVFFPSIIFKKSINHTQNKPSVSKHSYTFTAQIVYICVRYQVYLWIISTNDNHDWKKVFPSLWQKQLCAVVLANISVLINDVCMMDTSLEQAETEVRETWCWLRDSSETRCHISVMSSEGPAVIGLAVAVEMELSNNEANHS